MQSWKEQILVQRYISGGVIDKETDGSNAQKRRRPAKLGKRIAFIQSGLKIKLKRKKISAVVNPRGAKYADAIGQVQRFCGMKSEPVTAWMFD